MPEGISFSFRSPRAMAGALARPPKLLPLFPMGHFTPKSLCAHIFMIPRGSIWCCMVCHQSGQDDHPALQNDRMRDNSSWRELSVPARPALAPEVKAAPPKTGDEDARRASDRKRKNFRLFNDFKAPN